MVVRPSKMFCHFTCPIATGAAIVGSSPVGSTDMPVGTDVFGAAAAGPEKPATANAPAASKAQAAKTACGKDGIRILDLLHGKIQCIWHFVRDHTIDKIPSLRSRNGYAKPAGTPLAGFRLRAAHVTLDELHQRIGRKRQLAIGRNKIGRAHV